MRAEIEELRCRLDELEGKSATPKPSPDFKRINPLDRLSLPSEVLKEFAQNVSDRLIRDIVNDNRSRRAARYGGAAGCARGAPAYAAAYDPISGTVDKSG
jgi:hypothetical protein